jgi:hypothetical protein
MNTDQLRTAVQAVVAADPDVADRDELAGMVAAARRLRAALDAFDVRCSRRSRELADTGRAEAPESMFGRTGGRSAKQSREIAERTDVGDALPAFEEALGSGVVSAGHLDALATARRGLEPAQRADFDDHEPSLLAAAGTQGVDSFTRRCRELARKIVADSRQGSDADELDAQRRASTVKRWTDKVSGMCVTRLELDPVRDAQVWAAVDRTTARLRAADGNARTPWSQLQVGAFVEAVSGDGRFDDTVDTVDTDDPAAMVDGARGGAERLPNVPEMSVLIDYRTLVDGFHDHSICETDDGVPLPVSTVRRMCCEAEIIPVVLGSNGEALDVGRTQRTANRAQRRALRAMHRTCAHPDCTVGFSACRIHHVRWWWRDSGPTDIDNLLPLCERHHHQVHEGGWGLTMTIDRVATWTRPDGTVDWTGNTIDRSPASGSSTSLRSTAPDHADRVTA